MDNIFINLYLDEDVNVLVADIIKARGFQITTTRDESQLQKSDDEQFAFAVNNKLTLVTHNRVDFEELVKDYYEQGKIHYGVIFAVRHSPQEIARRLLIILNNVTADEMINQVKYI
jgi:predicted nuclease of predicted toxin-antitoxin system